MSDQDVKAEPSLTALERKWAQEAAEREQTLTDAYKEGSLDVQKIPGSVLERIPKPTGWRIVILPYRGAAKSKGGILLADQTIEKITVATTCGYVLSVGPLAYADTAKFPSGPWCKPGDWIIFGRYAGARMNIDGGEIRILNDDEILDFVQLTLQKDYEVRFIELMPVGRAENDFTNGYMSSEEIKARLPQLIPVEQQEGVAEIYRTRGALGRIGFITPISCNFCSQCNKLRLTADGKLKTCLHSEKEIDLKKALREGQPGDLEKVLTEAIMGKEEKHHLGSGQAPISRDMNKIGG